MDNEQRNRYLASARRQLRRELDEMGYGQRSWPAPTEKGGSRGTTGFIMALATMMALFAGLSITGLVS